TGETVIGTAATAEADKGRALEMTVGSGFGLGDPFPEVQRSEAAMNAILDNTALRGPERVQVAKSVQGSQMYDKAASVLREWDEATSTDGNTFSGAAIRVKFTAIHGWGTNSDTARRMIPILRRIKNKVDQAAATQSPAARPAPATRG
ncbi:unnamed protein product, partial [marine sediment metagenome]